MYKDLNARDYAILQDDLQRVERDVRVARVRVMRQRHPYVQSGTIRISSDVFRRIAATDRDRNTLISSALVAWLQNQSMKVRFAVRASVADEETGGVTVRFEEAAVQST